MRAFVIPVWKIVYNMRKKEVVEDIVSLVK